jgi:23S rRNA (guanosine2251-2'-O)-methyltransferase
MILTGFHAVEEKVRSLSKSADSESIAKTKIYFSKPGPRVKKILEQAKKCGILCSEVSMQKLDEMTHALEEGLKEHRGIVMELLQQDALKQNIVDFNAFVVSEKNNIEPKRSVVMLLDSVTDPHNVGAIMRSMDQFAGKLLVLPEKRSAKDSEVIQRTSAGSASYVPVSIVPNLVRAVQKLKEAGYWIYAADFGGTDVKKIQFPKKTAIVMGSEGSGISRLLKENCDEVVSIPTFGKIDSLNVSVAAGVLLFATL